MGNGEWGMGKNRKPNFLLPPLPTPYSPLLLLLYFPLLNWSATGRFSSTDECGRGMTCTLTSSPTRRAAAAPASVAAFTAATSPRTIAVTKPPPIFSYPTRLTFAALTIASAASIIATNPFVSIIPSASINLSLNQRPVDRSFFGILPIWYSQKQPLIHQSCGCSLD